MDTHILSTSAQGAEAPPNPMAQPRPPSPPRRYGRWNALGFSTLIRREVARFVKVWAQTLIAPVMSTLLFMMVFSFAFPDRSWAGTGIPYAAGLAPGLIMLGVLSNAFQNTSSSMVGAKMQGTSVDFLMPPLSAAELTAAFLIGAIVRGLAVGMASVAAVAAFADITPIAPWAVIYFSVVGAILFGAIGLIGGIWADKFDHLSAVTTFIITPLTMLSGTFYSVDVLPPGLGFLLHWNPVFFLIDGFRYGFIGQAHSNLVEGVIYTALLASGMSAAAWALIRSGYRLKA